MSNLKVTSLDQLRQYAEGVPVELPDTAEGQPLVIAMRRPSLLDMINRGAIPNPLLNTATALFTKGGKGIDSEDPQVVKDLIQLLEVFCEASFVNPTYSQIKEAGLQLTDEQLMFVFNYIQVGNKALEKFRSQPENPVNNGDGAKVRKNTRRNSAN